MKTLICLTLNAILASSAFSSTQEQWTCNTAIVGTSYGYSKQVTLYKSNAGVPEGVVIEEISGSFSSQQFSGIRVLSVLYPALYVADASGGMIIDTENKRVSNSLNAFQCTVN